MRVVATNCNDPRTMSDPLDTPARHPGAGAPNIVEAVGGPLGMVESALPTVVFVAAVTMTDKDIRLSSIIAVAVAVAMAAVRLARGQTIRYTLGGLAGVAFAAFVAAKTGKAENFFLPGLLLNLAYAAAAVISIAVRRPLAGYALVALRAGDLTGGWHRDPAFVRATTRATWVLAAIFVARLAVQLPMYLGDALVALGIAKVAMGLPLFALGLWIAWLMLRGVPLPASARRTAT